MLKITPLLHGFEVRAPGVVRGALARLAVALAVGGAAAWGLLPAPAPSFAPDMATGMQSLVNGLLLMAVVAVCGLWALRTTLGLLFDARELTLDQGVVHYATGLRRARIPLAAIDGVERAGRTLFLWTGRLPRPIRLAADRVQLDWLAEAILREAARERATEPSAEPPEALQALRNPQRRPGRAHASD